jgi:hypothetical protein
MRTFIFCLFLLSSCGYQIEQTGEGLIKVEIVATFLQDLKDICSNAYIVSDYETIELYNQAVSQCVLDCIDTFDLSWLQGAL